MNNKKLKSYSQQPGSFERFINPEDISLPRGYQAEAYSQGLDTPISIIFTDYGELLAGEEGLLSGNPRVLRITQSGYEVIADGFQVPLTGINYLNGEIYVSHRGYITVIHRDGSKENVLAGLPSYGDHCNSPVTFGIDRKMYFAQGTITNSGVVGLDNTWVLERPLLYDRPGAYIILNGQNFGTNNILSAGEESAFTGGFAPYGVPNRPFEVERGYLKASGSILRANLDGTQLEQVAWGFRNPAKLKFDENQNLFISDRGYDVRGSRPIANAPDEFYLVNEGAWYGWPDFSAGEPVTLPKFRPEGGLQPEFLLNNHPGEPPRPFAKFAPHSTIMGFDFNYNQDFGTVGDVYIAEFGSLGFSRTGSMPYAGIGHRISKIAINNGQISTFAINKSGFPASITGEGGFGRPTDIAFGPDGAMYVSDSTTGIREDPGVFIRNSGVIWRISRI